MSEQWEGRKADIIHAAHAARNIITDDSISSSHAGEKIEQIIHRYDLDAESILLVLGEVSKNVVKLIDDFEAKCEDYTDTGDAWDVLNRISDTLADK